jgi:GNAT superfamily N-acetyltransferase
MLTLRPAAADDLEVLARLWYERAVLAPRPRGLALLPDARARWQAAAMGWLSAPDHVLLVAQAETQIAGFAAGRITRGPTGFAPEQVGEVLALALDGHTYHAGAGRALIHGLRDWFRERGVTTAFASVPQAGPVEQAFWRALGAVAGNEDLWLTF